MHERQIKRTVACRHRRHGRSQMQWRHRRWRRPGHRLQTCAPYPENCCADIGPAGSVGQSAPSALFTAGEFAVGRSFVRGREPLAKQGVERRILCETSARGRFAPKSSRHRRRRGLHSCRRMRSWPPADVVLKTWWVNGSRVCPPHILKVHLRVLGVDRRDAHANTLAKREREIAALLTSVTLSRPSS